MLEKHCGDDNNPISSILAKIYVKPEANPRFVVANTVPFHYREMTRCSRLLVLNLFNPLTPETVQDITITPMMNFEMVNL